MSNISRRSFFGRIIGCLGLASGLTGELDETCELLDIRKYYNSPKNFQEFCKYKVSGRNNYASRFLDSNGKYSLEKALHEALRMNLPSDLVEKVRARGLAEGSLLSDSYQEHINNQNILGKNDFESGFYHDDYMTEIQRRIERLVTNSLGYSDTIQENKDITYDDLQENLMDMNLRVEWMRS